jgi:hypothetical protein
MDQQQWMNLFLFFAILLGAFFLYKYLQKNNYIEGMETNTANGLAANSEQFDQKLQEYIQKSKDELNIDKYRTQYENIVLHMDDWTSLFMLKSILLAQSPEQAMPMLAVGSLVRNGLNNVLKFSDKEKSSGSFF